MPSDNATNVASTCGLFVSSSLGTADGTGTQDKPYESVSAALADWDGRPIYVCGETITEAETVKVATGDVTLYGALNCAKGWVYDPTKKSKLVGAADKVTLAVGKDAGLSVADFEVEAVDATLDGGSSVAVVAELGATLNFSRCDVTAGGGKDGAAGEPYSDPAAPGTDGNAGTAACTGGVVVGGESVTNACDAGDPNDDSISGAGGVGQDSSGGDGSNGKPAGTDNRGVGEDAVACTDGQAGDTGLDGANTSGGKGLGELTSQGFTGKDGDAGGKGKPGQGGGGGGGAKGGTGGTQCNDMTNKGGASGGSGGSGGCGGLGGKGGQAAGASLGLVSLGATLTFKEVSITTAAGGTGGEGGDPQAGGFGAGGGAGGAKVNSLNPGCAGGGGGKGGKGGLGGGGTGGHSLGLAYKGAAPDVKGVTFQVGSAGDGGKGSGGVDDAALHGDAGLACNTLSFDEGAASCAK